MADEDDGLMAVAGADNLQSTAEPKRLKKEEGVRTEGQRVAALTMGVIERQKEKPSKLAELLIIIIIQSLSVS